jgi:hypothetical protein
MELTPKICAVQFFGKAMMSVSWVVMLFNVDEDDVGCVLAVETRWKNKTLNTFQLGACVPK